MDAKPAVIPSPEVSQLAVPLGLGGRIIIASDGAWRHWKLGQVTVHARHVMHEPALCCQCLQRTLCARVAQGSGTL